MGIRPQELYAQHGDVGKVVFPCGYTLASDGDTLRIYYGAADTTIAMATGSVEAMERTLSGSKTLYYAVQGRDMTVWVPADSKVGSRVRSPTPKPRFQGLLTILF